MKKFGFSLNIVALLPTMVMFLPKFLRYFFAHLKTRFFLDKFYSSYKRLYFPATLASALVIHLQII